MSDVRLLTQEERKALDPIAKSHGITFEGGSRVIEDGKETFYLGFTGVMATYGNELGRKVKKALNANRLVLHGPGHQEVLE